MSLLDRHRRQRNKRQTMECESPLIAPQAPVGRRTFFQWLTYGLSAAAAAVLSLPLLGYFVGVRKRDVHWVPLDEVGHFPVNQTRLQTFDNPLRQPWDGMTALTGVYVRNLGADERGEPRF